MFSAIFASKVVICAEKVFCLFLFCAGVLRCSNSISVI